MLIRSGLWANKEQVFGSFGCQGPEKPKIFTIFFSPFFMSVTLPEQQNPRNLID